VIQVPVAPGDEVAADLGELGQVNVKGRLRNSRKSSLNRCG
jgi:hypothetical protein